MTIHSSHHAREKFAAADLYERMLSTVQEWYVKQIFWDVAIDCKDGTLYAHKHMLASASPYFRALVYGPLILYDNNTKGEVHTRLEFKKSTVQLFLDCVYQTDKCTSEVDVIEFIRFCDYIAVPELYREGLRFAGTLIGKDDCIRELNVATSSSVRVLPWVDALALYMAAFLPLDSIDVEELSLRAATSLMSAIPFSQSSTSLALKLLFRALSVMLDSYFMVACCNAEVQELVDFVFFYAWDLICFGDSINYPECTILDKLDSNMDKVYECHTALCPMAHDDAAPPQYRSENGSEEIVLKLFSYEFHPKDNMVYYENTTQMKRFLHHRTQFRDDDHYKELKLCYFEWRNTLCTVQYDTKTRTLLINQYAWFAGEWRTLIKHTIEDGEGATIEELQCCHIIHGDILVFAIEKFTGGNPAYFSELHPFNLAKEEPLRLIRIDNFMAHEMHLDGDNLLVFEHPWRVFKVNKDFDDGAVKDITPPSDLLPYTDNDWNSLQHLLFSDYRRLIPFRGRLYHIYCISRKPGIAVAVFDSSEMCWKGQSTMLSETYWLYDAFVANDALYVVHATVTETILLYESGDFAKLEREPLNMLVGRCSSKENEHGEYEFHLIDVPTNPQLKTTCYYDEDDDRRRGKRNLVRLVLPKRLIPLDSYD